MNFFENKTEAAQFAEEIEHIFPGSSPSITITPQGKYVVSYASTAIGLSSDDTEQETAALIFSATQSNT